VIQQVPGIPSLFVLPVGITPNPVELVERPAFGLLMRELVSKFDHVLIVDTPAARLGSDASVIAARCGGALIVARRNASVDAHWMKVPRRPEAIQGGTSAARSGAAATCVPCTHVPTLSHGPLRRRRGSGRCLARLQHAWHAGAHVDEARRNVGG